MRLKLSKNSIIAAIAVVLIAAIIIAIMQIFAPHPSVAAYCKLYKAENAAIAQNNSPKELANAYAKLGQVAPGDIKNDTITLRKVYQKIESDSSQSLTESFSGLTAEANVESWVRINCIH
jgi:predicted cobalt transporter CbtA